MYGEPVQIHRSHDRSEFIALKKFAGLRWTTVVDGNADVPGRLPMQERFLCLRYDDRSWAQRLS